MTGHLGGGDRQKDAAYLGAVMKYTAARRRYPMRGKPSDADLKGIVAVGSLCNAKWLRRDSQSFSKEIQPCPKI